MFLEFFVRWTLVYLTGLFYWIIELMLSVKQLSMSGWLSFWNLSATSMQMTKMEIKNLWNWIIVYLRTNKWFMVMFDSILDIEIDGIFVLKRNVNWSMWQSIWWLYFSRHWWRVGPTRSNRSSNWYPFE